MIPLQLTLKNFLSYREATLDFRGLHIACICGANGAGKSSLLEAIAWAVWGQSRASEDDVIHQGTEEARVDFIFRCHQQTYRIIRSRYRTQPSVLEFQMEIPGGFRSLTERSVRATQQRILQHLRLDYETFVNSAYLRQGRADEFMLKRPSERKQILADLLKLDQYELLAEQAKEQARQLKAEMGTIDRSLTNIATALAQEATLVTDQATIEAAIAQMQQQQQTDSHTLQKLWAVQQQRQTWQQQRTMLQQQQQHLGQDCQRLQQELAAASHEQQTLGAIVAEQKAIGQGFAHFQHLQAQEEAQAAKFRAHQAAQTRRQQLQQQQADQIRDLKTQQQQAQMQLETLQQQAQEIQHILSKSEDIARAIEQLRQARLRLSTLDQLQLQASPLMQRRQQIQTDLDRAQTRLSTRLEELQSIAQQLQTQQARQPQIQQAVLEVTGRVEYLEQRRNYQQRVREKGIERRNFLERLQANQREYERQLAVLDHKIQMLQQSVGTGRAQEFGVREIEENAALQNLPLLTVEPPNPHFPPCPLCDRPLDEHHWQVVLERHRVEQQEIRRQIWVIREQLAVSDREIQLMRQEYQALDQELGSYSVALERKGQLQEQLHGASAVQIRLSEIAAEQAELQRSLQAKNYASALHEELDLLDRSLQQLGYDDKDHALARGEVDRWRWAEIKQAELKQAQKRQAQLAQQQPELETTIATIEQQLADLAHAPLQQQIDRLDAEIAQIDYDFDRHNHLRQTLRQAQSWQLRYQELMQAQQHYPQMQQRVYDLTHLLETRSQAYQTVHAQIASLDQQLTQTPDRTLEIQALERSMQERRLQLDSKLAHQGRLQQQMQQLTEFKAQHSELSEQLQTARRQQRVYQELAQAFGKNGIQALMIENLLPQLEIEANHILGRLSANQLHIQFVTQRSRRGKSTAPAKLIDTLDILIADLHGTRSYETYSGGEAFRVNFAIRLALARLLAQRSGTALQLLIIDEGFGTQDEAGCDRLIGAIQAIAADFACILTVTHMPHFKEAFQTRIEVCKTNEGSRISLSA